MAATVKPVLRGFTIMEVIMAAALFAISILVLMGAFPLTSRAVRKAQVRTIAIHLAENQLERARAADVSTIADVPAYSIGADIVNNGTAETADFSISQSVTTVSPGLKRVRVTVNWTREGVDQTVYLETDLASTLP